MYFMFNFKVMSVCFGGFVNTMINLDFFSLFFRKKLDFQNLDETPSGMLLLLILLLNSLYLLYYLIEIVIIHGIIY